MRRFPGVIALMTLLLFSKLSLAQEGYPKDYFQAPMDIQLLLSGNFGELRSNHFHSGIDIKTHGSTGLAVKATADGYVYRIKVSPYGYGKALYLAHPNGYVTVYAHLEGFKEEIADYVKKEQYRQETFDIQLFPDADIFPVKKGEVIGYSGNSGGSGGPHLHFEIREQQSEKPLNALFFGFDVKDTRPPVIQQLAVYPMDENSYVDSQAEKKVWQVSGGSGSYMLNRTPEVSGTIGFGIETYDLLNGAPNHNGVYSIELKLNGERIYYHEINEFAFHETRFINSHIDYEEEFLHNDDIQRSYKLPGNQLKFYKGLSNNGLLEIEAGEDYKLEYIVKDAHDNASSLKFTVKGTEKPADIKSDTATHFIKRMEYQKSNFYIDDEVEIRIPPYSLYQDLNFTFNRLPEKETTFSPVYQVHKIHVPVHRYYSLSINIDSVPTRLEDKLLIVSYSKNGYPIAEGGKLRGNTITVKTRSFGDYTVMADTVPPNIRPLNIHDGKDMSASSKIQVKVSDDLSGIGYIRPTINGKWVLMDYDAKNNLLTYEFDERTNSGANVFELFVADKRNNMSSVEYRFVR